jgi:hypothetical protein
MSDYTGVGVKPVARGIRDELSNDKMNGRVSNPPRFPVLGGFKNKTVAFFKNTFGIVKPGDTK